MTDRTLKSLEQAAAIAKVIAVLKREIRLTCRDNDEGGCELIVKPGNIEHCAQLVVKTLSE